MAIYSGGNIHKILRLATSKDGESITLKKMKKVRKQFKAFTVSERITQLGLKPYRADVILPAHKIYYSVLKWGQIPQMGWPTASSASSIINTCDLLQVSQQPINGFELNNITFE